MVCLIPTTIGALLAAIGIAGMDRALAANLIAKSGKAVEVAGDIDTLLLDKTGTITLGNRRATSFVPMEGTSDRELARLAAMASLADTTPEGKSIVELARQLLALELEAPTGSRFVEFTAQTRMSGIDLPDGMQDPQRRTEHDRQGRSELPAARSPTDTRRRSTRSPRRGRRRWPSRRATRSSD